MKLFRNIVSIPAFLSCILLSSCRKELCYDHNHAANVHIKVNYSLDWCTHRGPEIEDDDDWVINWDEVLPTQPDGVRLTTYPHVEGLSRQVYNMPNSGGKIRMNAGLHDMLLYNNDTEYILFEGTGAMASATTRTRTRISYSNTYPSETTVNPPDMLFAAFITDWEIFESDLNKEPDNYKVIDTELSPRVFSYIIRYEFKSGLQYVSQSRGALTSMSGSVYLASGHTAEDPVTLLFDCKKVDYGCEVVLASFGVPGITFDRTDSNAQPGVRPYPVTTKGEDHFYYNRDEANKVIKVNRVYEHRLNLELYLTNGKEKMIELDVTDQVNSQPRGGIIVVRDLIVTDEEGEGPTNPGGGSGGGGFDTSVEGWEDDKIVEIPIN